MFFNKIFVRICLHSFFFFPCFQIDNFSANFYFCCIDKIPKIIRLSHMDHWKEGEKERRKKVIVSIQLKNACCCCYYGSGDGGGEEGGGRGGGRGGGGGHHCHCCCYNQSSYTEAACLCLSSV